MTSTTRIQTLTFELQMAEQAIKFGARLRELKKERGLLGRQLVEKMADLGDDSLNTNQLSRYENGGAFPGEQRRQRFAEALDTTAEDLMAGPLANRKKPKTNNLNGLFNGAEADALPPVLRKALAGLAKGQREMLEGQKKVLQVLSDVERQLKRGESQGTAQGS